MGYAIYKEDKGRPDGDTGFLFMSKIYWNACDDRYSKRISVSVDHPWKGEATVRPDEETDFFINHP